MLAFECITALMTLTTLAFKTRVSRRSKRGLVFYLLLFGNAESVAAGAAAGAAQVPGGDGEGVVQRRLTGDS